MGRVGGFYAGRRRNAFLLKERDSFVKRNQISSAEKWEVLSGERFIANGFFDTGYKMAIPDQIPMLKVNYFLEVGGEGLEVTCAKLL